MARSNCFFFSSSLGGATSSTFTCAKYFSSSSSTSGSSECMNSKLGDQNGDVGVSDIVRRCRRFKTSTEPRERRIPCCCCWGVRGDTGTERPCRIGGDVGAASAIDPTRDRVFGRNDGDTWCCGTFDMERAVRVFGDFIPAGLAPGRGFPAENGRAPPAVAIFGAAADDVEPETFFGAGAGVGVGGFDDDSGIVELILVFERCV